MTTSKLREPKKMGMRTFFVVGVPSTKQTLRDARAREFVYVAPLSRHPPHLLELSHQTRPLELEDVLPPFPNIGTLRDFETD